MKISVIIVDKEAEKFRKIIVKKIKKLEKLIHKNGLIEVYLVAGKRMRMLNKKFMKKDKDTNVLTFVSPKDFPDKCLGEIYLNPVYIQKNNQDLALMLAHGVLHILGYNHKTKNDRIKMEKKEAELLFKIKN
jgi:probable rRNA maturation factor